MTALISAVLLAPTPMQRLDVRLRRIAAPFRGRLGYCVRRLDTGEEISFRGDERFPTASTIKTAVALHAVREVEAGRRKWTDLIPLPDAKDRVEYDVSEWSYYMKDGMKINLDGYVNLMLTYSDNLATRVLRENLGTVNVNRSLAALGLKNTLLLASTPKEETRLRRLGGQFGMGMTTPREMATLLEKIYRGKAAGKAGCEKMVRLLRRQYWDDWIGGSVPPNVVCASKSGAISRSRSDTALVYAPIPYVVTAYTDAQRDRRWTGDNEGDQALIKIGREVWNGLQSRPYTPPPGSERFAPTGGGVEDS